jgi:hypothetical protein
MRSASCVTFTQHIDVESTVSKPDGDQIGKEVRIVLFFKRKCFIMLSSYHNRVSCQAIYTVKLCCENSNIDMMTQFGLEQYKKKLTNF